MSEIKDNPQEVLALLNSLGFVGITAAQLKAFMKDLKMYRKVKEREKQQRKEEIKTKLIKKQQDLIKEAYEHQNTDYLSNNNVSSEPSNSFDNEPLVKIRIRCIPKEDNVQKQEHSKATVIKLDQKLSTRYHKEHVIQVAESNRIDCKQNHLNTKSYPIIRHSKSQNRQNAVKCSAKNNCFIESQKSNLRIEEEVKPITSVHEHPTDEPVLSNYVSKSQSKGVPDPTGNMRAQSALSMRSSVNSGHKSFIRPWRLQPEAQRNVNKKCDPVALYQKYQQQWKQISFPGEAKHSKIRWAVREKMLGGDPHPMPLPRKCVSMPILKKK